MPPGHTARICCFLSDVLLDSLSCIILNKNGISEPDYDSIQIVSQFFGLFPIVLRGSFVHFCPITGKMIHEICLIDSWTPYVTLTLQRFCDIDGTRKFLSVLWP